MSNSQRQNAANAASGSVMSDRVHVIPLGDLYEHEDSLFCPCSPYPEDDGRVIVHNAWDGREVDEQAATTNKRPKVDQ